jgi:hypothetical protein
VCAHKATHPLVTAVEKRIVDVVNVAHAALRAHDEPESTSRPPVCFTAAEPLQVVRYTVGQSYCAHFDNRSGSITRKGAAARALLR